MFIKSLSTEALCVYVAKQMDHFFPDKQINPAQVNLHVKKALKRTEYCFSNINVKYYTNGTDVFFNHLNADHYVVFLSYLANTVWKDTADVALSSKIYYLNKSLHAFNLFYEIDLPDIFLLVHPFGTVLGRGRYKDYLVVYQRVSIGADKDDIYPVLGKGVVLYGGSALIGDCNIGNNCLVSAGTIVMGETIPDDCVIFKKNSQTAYKKTSKSVMDRYFISR
ncbi:MAG: serine acetyltransferase [Pseudomonadota bacterium]